MSGLAGHPQMTSISREPLTRPARENPKSEIAGLAAAGKHVAEQHAGSTDSKTVGGLHERRP